MYNEEKNLKASQKFNVVAHGFQRLMAKAL